MGVPQYERGGSNLVELLFWCLVPLALVLFPVAIKLLSVLLALVYSLWRNSNESLPVLSAALKG